MPRINSITVQGFRSFGPNAERLDFKSPLSIVWGSNSQGKTSLAEAIEFLLTGQTVRREFIASAAREFSDCLRNAHLDAGVEVAVSAEIVDADGGAHAVKRKLITDYSAGANCVSELTSDGVVVTDLCSLGVRLSHPPLAAPILMQHSLRFVLSAKPQERSDYFKALLEISDLEQVRAAIDQSKPATTGPSASHIQHLESCAARSELSGSLRPLLRQGQTRAHVENALAAAVGALLPEGERDGLLEERLGRLRNILAEKRKTSFPVEALRCGIESRRGKPEDSLWEELNGFAGMVAEAEREAARLAQVFAHLLEIPGIAGASEAVDCPVCESPRALTPARVEAIRARVRATEEHRDARRRAGAHIQRLTTLLEEAERTAKQAVPPSATWDAAARGGRGLEDSAMLELLGEAGREQIAAWKAEDDAIVVALAAVISQCDLLRAEVTGLPVDDLTKEQVARVRAEFEKLAGCCGSLDAALAPHLPAHEALRKSLEDAVGRQTKTEGWQELVELAEGKAELLSELVDVRVKQQVTADWERAIRDLDAAITSVFDSKFADLGDEISRWWKLLRPDELTSFAGVQRAGTGRRFIDLKAGLAADGGETKVRDAVGVFSDSQLNCLGLSAFLARGVREKVGFIILDDPVPASDREHRAMFILKVLDELVRSDCQVIVLTHDDDTWKDVQERYKHLNPDTYALCLNDAARGTEAKNTGDTVGVMLDRARPYVRNADSAIRKIAAGLLRDAAERLCKVLLVRDRQAKGDSAAALSDYDGENLGQLQPRVDPLLTRDPADHGKLRTVTRLLNPGNHDDSVPLPGDLVVCLGELEAFRRAYAL